MQFDKIRYLDILDDKLKIMQSQNFKALVSGGINMPNSFFFNLKILWAYLSDF